MLKCPHCDKDQDDLLLSIRLAKGGERTLLHSPDLRKGDLLFIAMSLIDIMVSVAEALRDGDSGLKPPTSYNKETVH